jgi:hypothetical protein
MCYECKKFYNIGNRRGWPLGNSPLSECHGLKCFFVYKLSKSFVHLWICPSVHLSICPHFDLFICPSVIGTSFDLLICLPVFQYFQLFINLFNCLSICPAVYQSVQLFINLFSCLTICSALYQSAQLFINLFSCLSNV